MCTTIILHTILLILGEIWSKGSKFTSSLLIKIFVKVVKVNTKIKQILTKYEA